MRDGEEDNQSLSDRIIELLFEKFESNTGENFWTHTELRRVLGIDRTVLPKVLKSAEFKKSLQEEIEIFTLINTPQMLRDMTQWRKFRDFLSYLNTFLTVQQTAPKIEITIKRYKKPDNA